MRCHVAAKNLPAASPLRAPTLSEAARLELQRQTNAVLPLADPFTDAVVSGFRLKARVYEKIRAAFVKQYIDKQNEKREKWKKGAPGQQQVLTMLKMPEASSKKKTSVGEE